MRVEIIVRETGRLKPDYSLPFEMESAPRIGDYISIFRPDSETHTEDLVVKQVWWHLHSPVRLDSTSNAEPKSGKVRALQVECEVAIGPYARDHWRELAKGVISRGGNLVEFEVARFSVSERELSQLGDPRADNS